MSKKIVIIDYGAGNVQSVKYAVQRLGYRARLSADHNEIQQADKVIFPGVGQAKHAMEQLRDKGIESWISELKQPFLGVCLGMQLMCRKTEEGDTEGLGIFDLEVRKFSDDLKIPHMGWNQIENLKSPLFKNVKNGAFVYFVHSFYMPSNRFSVADTDYGIRFCSAVQKDNFYGVQFHPEKSGKTGEVILKNFLEI